MIIIWVWQEEQMILVKVVNRKSIYCKTTFHNFPEKQVNLVVFVFFAVHYSQPVPLLCFKLNIVNFLCFVSFHSAAAHLLTCIVFARVQLLLNPQIKKRLIHALPIFYVDNKCKIITIRCSDLQFFKFFDLHMLILAHFKDVTKEHLTLFKNNLSNS